MNPIEEKFAVRPKLYYARIRNTKEGGMKRRFLLLAVGLVLLLGLSSCYIFRANHFIGDWKGDVSMYGVAVTMEFSFDSDMNFSGRMTIPGYAAESISGTYDYTDTDLTITQDGYTPTTMPYDFSRLYRTLTLTSDGVDMVFERQ